MTFTFSSVLAAEPSSRGTAREGALGQAAASALTLILLWSCTNLLIYLRHVTHAQRPYTILYLIPVAIGAALLGVRGGVIASVAALLLSRIYLFNDQRHGLALFSYFPYLSEDVEFASLALGTLTIAFVTGHLRQTLSLLRATNLDLASVNVQLRASEHQQRVFNRDVLLAVTGGKLRLVEADEIPPPDLRADDPVLSLPLQKPLDAGELRHALQKLASDSGMDRDRVADLCTSVTEGATNAIKHGGGGAARVWTDPESIWVEIRDRGEGIAPSQLARATLEAGYSTRVSLGMGFFMMLQTADALALCTSSHGTTVLLQIANRPRLTDQESLLARYASI
jgi:anti-sigma regulatory factor (Ser/Thr protein kinase)